MSAEQVQMAQRLLEAAREGPDGNSASSVDRFLRELVETVFPSNQTLSPGRVRELVAKSRETVATFDGSAEELVEWFREQLEPSSIGFDPHDAAFVPPGQQAAEDSADGAPDSPEPDFKDQQTLVAPLGEAARPNEDTLGGDAATLPLGLAGAGDAAEVDEDATLMGEAVDVPAAPSSNVVAPDGRDFGDYVLLEEIARGGMGVVYKARQRKLNRVVALKMILSGQFAHESEVERFYIEAEAAANLSHDNIVTIYEVGEHDGQHFFSMDYIEGTSLGDAVEDGPLAAEEAANLMVSISDAIQFAHEAGILHRDLKPSNVLLDQQQKPLLTDFGLAKQVGEGMDLTMSGAVVGTPSYMPPEQAAARADEVGVGSDVYSLGAILYELITGQPPFRAATTFDTLNQVLSSEPTSPRDLNSAVPVDLETICLKCLQKEPAKRYLSARELIEELERFLEGRPILARPVGRFERAVRWCKRNPVVASLSGLAATAVVVTMVYIVYSNIQIAAALKDSDESFRDAKKAVDDFFTSVAEDDIWKRYPATRAFQQDLLTRGLEFYERFVERRGESALLGKDIAIARANIAFAYLRQGSRQDALKYYSLSIATLEELYAQDEQDPELMLALTNCLTGFAQAQADSKKVDDMALAATSFERAREIREAISRANGEDPEVRRKLANAFMNEGIVRQEAARLNEALTAEERKAVRTKVYELVENAQQIRRQVLDASGSAAVRPRSKIRVLRDLGKGAVTLYELFDEEFSELDEQANKLAAWENANRYLDDVLDVIGRIDPVQMTMQDRQQMINAVQKKITWLVYYPTTDNELPPYKYSDALSVQISKVLPLADRLSFDVETPDYQKTAVGFYLEVAQFAYDAQDDELVIDAFRRLGAGWTSVSPEHRSKQISLIAGDIGGLVSDYLGIAKEMIELDKDVNGGQQMLNFGVQLLEMARTQQWLTPAALDGHQADIQSLRAAVEALQAG